MDNLSPVWHSFLKNLGWYVTTMIFLIVLLIVTRHPIAMIIMWIVGLFWGIYLAYNLSQLLFGDTKIAINEARLKEYLGKVASYKEKIDRAINSSSRKIDQINQERLSLQIEGWSNAIISLAERLNNLYQNDIIQQDIKQAPKAIANLETQLKKEIDPDIRTQLERAINNRKKQIDSLNELQNSIKRAEIQIESTVSMLGTIYSQILTGQSTNHISSYNRLSANIDEEVLRLQDHLDALYELKLDREQH